VGVPTSRGQRPFLGGADCDETEGTQDHGVMKWHDALQCRYLGKAVGFAARVEVSPRGSSGMAVEVFRTKKLVKPWGENGGGHRSGMFVLDITPVETVVKEGRDVEVRADIAALLDCVGEPTSGGRVVSCIVGIDVAKDGFGTEQWKRSFLLLAAERSGLCPGITDGKKTCDLERRLGVEYLHVDSMMTGGGGPVFHGQSVFRSGGSGRSELSRIGREKGKHRLGLAVWYSLYSNSGGFVSAQGVVSLLGM
jgi:hypothetical protein